MGLKSPRKVVDAGASSGELLGSNGGVSFHCSGESIGHCVCNFCKFISTEVNESFS